MKKEKGITLVGLVMSIIILIIISSIAVYSGTGTVRYAKFNKAKSEMEIMQTNVNSWYQEYQKIEVSDSEEIPEGKTKEDVKIERQVAFINNYGVATSDSSCDPTALDKTVSATGITASDYRFLSGDYVKNNFGLDESFDFLVSIPERTVILFNGLKYNGEMYYTVEDFGVYNVSYNSPNSITFNLEQGDNTDIIISDLKIIDTENLETDISKFIVQYKKNSDSNYSNVISDVTKFVDENDDKTKFKFSVSEIGDYTIRISTTDKKIFEEKSIMVFEKKLTEEVTGIFVSTIDYTDNTESDDSKILTVDGAMLLSAGSQAVPSRVQNDKFVWRTSNSNVATVTGDGVVKCGTEPGIATITLYGSNGTSSKCRVKTTAKIATTSSNLKYTINGAEGSDVNPTIPGGFYPIDTNITGTTANNIEWKLTGNQINTGKGLVIMNEAGDQFVWVPLKKDEVVLDTTNHTIPSETEVTVTSDLYTPMATTYTYNGTTYYRSMLYIFSGDTTTMVRYNTGYVPGTIHYREPSLITGSSEDIWAPMTSVAGTENDAQYYTNAGFTETQGVIGFGAKMQEDYDEMITQVQAYGGFWVGRFESSFNDKTNKIACIAGAKSIVNNDKSDRDEDNMWYGLYRTHKAYSNTSSMIWDCQYDAMMNWMAKNGITVASETVMSGTTRNVGNDEINGKRITGNPKYNDKLNNVIDLYGNSYEWNLGACDNCNRTYRGGNIGHFFQPSYRGNGRSYRTGGTGGSRLTLYIK